MSVPARLGAFVVALLVAFAAAFAVGWAVGPLDGADDPGPPAHHQEPHR